MKQEHNPQSSCPYRGTHDDPEVRFGFPVANAYCYKASPPAQIDKSHQSTHCLTGDHVNCPVFQQRKAVSLPPEIAATPPSRRVWNSSSSQTKRPAYFWLLPLALLAIIGGGVIWSQVGNSEPLEPTIPAIGLIATETSTVVATQMAESVPPTATATPRATTTPEATNTATPTNTATVTNTPSPTPTTMPTETAIPTETVTPTQTPLPRPTATATPVSFDVAVRLDRVILRRGPESTYGMVASIGEAGEMVTAIGRIDNSLWVEICCIDGMSGWIPAGFVSLPGILQLPIRPAPKPLAIISEPVLDLLESPSYSAETVAIIEQGDELEIIGRSGEEWIKLCCVDNESGWVFIGTAHVDGDISALPNE